MSDKLYAPHQQRVVDEKAELSTKIVALVTFIEVNPIFASLSHDEQSQLRQQLSWMQGYSKILAERIAIFWAISGTEKGLAINREFP